MICSCLVLSGLSDKSSFSKQIHKKFNATWFQCMNHDEMEKHAKCQYTQYTHSALFLNVRFEKKISQHVWCGSQSGQWEIIKKVRFSKWFHSQFVVLRRLINILLLCAKATFVFLILIHSIHWLSTRAIRFADEIVLQKE